jgi:hypothetical protein
MSDRITQRNFGLSDRIAAPNFHPGMLMMNLALLFAASAKLADIGYGWLTVQHKRIACDESVVFKHLA